MTFSAYIKLAKKFNKGAGFGVLMVILPIIGLPMLAFGKSEYEGASNNDEKPSSILDVDMSGVPNTSEEPEFKYGYEKEATVVMDPVNSDSQNTEKTDNSKVVENPVVNTTENSEAINETPIDNVNIDNITVETKEGVLNASPDDMSNASNESSVVEEKQVENKVVDIPETNTTVQNSEPPVQENINITSEPLENSALDAQLNNVENSSSVVGQTTVEPAEEVKEVPVQIENIINEQSNSNTENSDDDFTEIN